MPNVIPTPVFIADKMLEFLFETTPVIEDCNRDYEADFLMTSDQIGRIVQIKNPPRFTTVDGPVITAIQSSNFGLTPFAIDKWKTIPIELTGMEKTFSNSKDLDMWASKNIKPIVSPFRAAIETAIFELANKVPNLVGTPGTGPTTVDPIAAAQEMMDNYETPSERVCYLGTSGVRKFLGGTTLASSGYLNPQRELGEMFKSGQIMSSVAGFEMKKSNKTAFLTTGSFTSTGANVLANGVYQTGAAIVVDAFTTNKTLKKGDVITFGVLGTATAVCGVNPVTGKTTGKLRQFVITADVTAAANAGTLSISPAVIPSGAFKNITGNSADLLGIPDNAEVIMHPSISLSTTYAQNLAWWKKAIGLVVVPIAPLEGLKSETRTHEGISITFSTSGDIMNFKTIKRADMAFGVDIFNAYLDQVCRITG